MELHGFVQFMTTLSAPETKCTIFGNAPGEFVY